MIEYWTIALIAILAAISPGPDFVIVAKNALAHHRRNAVTASLGIGIGVLVHVTYCVLGLAIIISQSIFLFNIIKYLGAAYLIYLGLKSLLNKSDHLPTQVSKKSAHRSAWLSFRDGLLTNVLNPKCTLFMLSVFTLVVKPHTPSLIQATYGIEIALITTLWFIFLSYSLTTRLVKSKLQKFQNFVEKVIGAVLVTLGMVVLFKTG